MRRVVYEKARKLRSNVSRQFAAICLSLLTLSALADEGNPVDIDYRLGEGFRVGNSGLMLGGYATAGAEKLRRAPERVALDDVSLFIWWEGEGRWKFFSELDYENIFAAPAASETGENRYLALERLYVDYALSDSTNIRAGKFLTPIGRWNLIHATPLVWTTSRPLITTLSFPTNVTGLMANGTLPYLENGLEYSIYASAGAEIRPSPLLDPFYEAFGAHLTLPLLAGNGQVGVSLASFEQKHTRGERKELVGLDFIWSRNRYEVSAEGIYRFSENGAAWDEKGAFVQLVVPLAEKLYAVGRYESYRKSREILTTQLWVAGLNYRISPAIVLKAELLDGRNNRINAPSGLMTSVSVLF